METAGDPAENGSYFTDDSLEYLSHLSITSNALLTENLSVSVSAGI